MDFFKIPEPDLGTADEQVDPLRETRPGPWVGGVMPLKLVVARSDQAAVLLTRITAFPDGFSFTVTPTCTAQYMSGAGSRY